MATSGDASLRILAVITGEYGQRHVGNLRAHAPAGWKIEDWRAPGGLPPIVDYPEDHVPEILPPADLVLALGEHRGVAELVPEVARLSGAAAVIAPVDREEWLPRGLARQLRGWLAEMGVACVTPKPFCSLTETHYNLRRNRTAYDDPLIAEFARWFGRPELTLSVDPERRSVAAVEVVRDACCGCARYVADRLVGVSVDEAEHRAGLAHHHYPCLAGMVKDVEFSDTLMHVSGNILKDRVKAQIQDHRQVAYITPGKLNEG